LVAGEDAGIARRDPKAAAPPIPYLPAGSTKQATGVAIILFLTSQ